MCAAPLAPVAPSAVCLWAAGLMKRALLLVQSISRDMSPGTLGLRARALVGAIKHGEMVQLRCTPSESPLNLSFRVPLD